MHRVFSVIGPEFDEVLLIPDYVDDLKLIHDTGKRVERLPLLFSDFRRNGHIYSSRKSEREHCMGRSVHFGEWLDNVIHRFYLIEIIGSIIVSRGIVGRASVLEVSYIVDCYKISGKCNRGKYGLIDFPVPIERRFFGKPPSESDGECNKERDEEKSLEYIPKGRKYE